MGAVRWRLFTKSHYVPNSAATCVDDITDLRQTSHYSYLDVLLLDVLGMALSAHVKHLYAL